MNEKRSLPSDSGAKLVLPDSGLDCTAAVRLFGIHWTAGLDGNAGSDSRAQWAEHVRGCQTCVTCFKGLASLSGLKPAEGPSKRIVVSTAKAAPCAANLGHLLSFLEAKIVGATAKFEPEINQHMCGCLACRQLFELFGEDLGLYFWPKTK